MPAHPSVCCAKCRGSPWFHGQVVRDGRNRGGAPCASPGETGVVVDPVEETTAAVDRVGDLDPRALRSRVEEGFSAEAMVAGYERAYERALAGERATDG